MSRRITQAGHSPPWPRRGGRDIKKDTAKPPLSERTGWFVQRPINRWFDPTTTSPPSREASRHFYYWRSHPSFAKEGSDPLSDVPA